MEILIKKKINIDADYNMVFSQVSDFNNWKNWSPWYVLEPNANYKIDGNTGSIGHKLSWKGQIIGEGSTEIIEKFDTEIAHSITNIKPYKSLSKTKFYFESQNKDGKKLTDVIWELKTSIPWYLFFRKKLFTKLLEKDLDRGLLMLQDFCETGSIPAKSINKGISSTSCINYIGIERRISDKDLSIAMKTDFEKLTTFLEKENKNSENWFTIYKNFDLVKEEIDYIACFSSEDFDTKQDISLFDKKLIRGVVPSSRIYKIEHQGDYKHLENSRTMGKTSIMAKKLSEKNYPLEKYINITNNKNIRDLKTEIIFPIK